MVRPSLGLGVAEVLGLFFLFDRLVVLFRSRVVGSFSGPLYFVGLFSCSPTPFCLRFYRFCLPCIWFAVPVGPVYHFLIRLSILAWHLLLFVVWSRALLVRWYRYFAVVVLAVPARLLSRRMWPSACRRGWCLWPTYILIQSLCLLMALASVARTPQATHWSQGCCPIGMQCRIWSPCCHAHLALFTLATSRFPIFSPRFFVCS